MSRTFLGVTTELFAMSTVISVSLYVLSTILHVPLYMHEYLYLIWCFSRILSKYKDLQFDFNLLLCLFVQSVTITFLSVRDRPFNLQGGVWFFVSFKKKLSDSTRVRIFIFVVAPCAKFFFQNLTLGYTCMTKTLNQFIIFFLHQNQNIFFSNIGNRNIFLEKNP